MPEIGETKTGKELGRKGSLSNTFSWLPCENCGEPRWVVLRHGEPLSKKCKKCSGYREEHEITCKECGKKFKVKRWRNNTAKYCSYECAIKGRTTSKAYSKERTCKKCGKKYFPTQWNQQYCSRECFTLTVRKREKINCPTCGKLFTQTRVSSKYCSRKCSEPFESKKTTYKKDYTDLLWANLVKLKAGNICEYCGNPNTLNSHHIFSRSNMSLRWDINNGICLCALHHVLGLFSAHKAPLEFAEWLKDKRGDEWYNSLKEKSKQVVKLSTPDRIEITESLKTKISEIQRKKKVETLCFLST